MMLARVRPPYPPPTQITCVVKKNCDPLVFGPLLAMDTAPLRSC